MTARLLIIDDDNRIAQPVTLALRRRFRTSIVRSLGEIPKGRFDVGVIGSGAPDEQESCQRLLETATAELVVIIGRSPSLEDTIRAIRAQASDFIPNGDDPEAVVARVTQMVELSQLRRELSRLKEGPTPVNPFPELIGESVVMRRLRALIERVSRSEASVLISGESGTGKETIARTLHAHGAHRTGPFVVVNSSAMSRHMIEAELFGSLSGQGRVGGGMDRRGYLLQAAGGSVFIDEVCELPLEVQARLLRALQTRSLRAPGQREDVPFNARVIAATSHDIEQEVARGTFREDLYSRLNASHLVLSPLRERGHDVLALAQHFIRRGSCGPRPVIGFTPAAAKALLGYRWPGNVRELEHCMWGAAEAARYDHVTLADLPDRVRAAGSRERDQHPGELISLKELERQHILEVLRAVGGNKALTSRRLGLDRKTLYRKLREYAVVPAPARTPEPAASEA